MLLILRSSAAFSLLKGSFGSLRFFSLGTSPTRGWRWPTGACITPPAPPPVPPEFFGTEEDPCANTSAPPIRTTSAIERIVVRILILPFVVFFYRTGASIVAQLRRPWAAQSCAFRTSAMVASNQIPAATSTTKKPSITAFSIPRWPSSSGGSRLPSPSSVIRGITALADRGERRRNSRRYDTAFPRIDHTRWNWHATNNSGQSAPFHGRREYRAHNPADIGPKRGPANGASVPGPPRSWCAGARFPARDRHDAGNTV